MPVQLLLAMLRNPASTGAVMPSSRTLANAIERAVIVSRGNLLTAADFPPDMAQLDRAAPAMAPDALADDMKLEDVERTLLLRALERSGNNLTRAARLLGMGRGALRYRLEKYGISAKDGGS